MTTREAALTATDEQMRETVALIDKLFIDGAEFLTSITRRHYLHVRDEIKATLGRPDQLNMATYGDAMMIRQRLNKK